MQLKVAMLDLYSLIFIQLVLVFYFLKAVRKNCLVPGILPVELDPLLLDERIPQVVKDLECILFNPYLSIM